MGTQVIMPQLGESVVEGKISRWLKQIGDPVKLYEPLLEVETDKVTTEVTAAGEGTLLELYANEGDVVKAGTLIALIGAVSEAEPHLRAGAQPLPDSSLRSEHFAREGEKAQRGNGFFGLRHDRFPIRLRHAAQIGARGAQQFQPGGKDLLQFALALHGAAGEIGNMIVLAFQPR